MARCVFPMPGGPKKSRFCFVSTQRQSRRFTASDFPIPLTRPKSKVSSCFVTGKWAPVRFLSTRRLTRKSISAEKMAFRNAS